MDFINKAMGGDKTNAETSQAQTQQSSSGGGIMGKLNSMAGGGPESEKNEDLLDKGMFIELSSRFDESMSDFFCILPTSLNACSCPAQLKLHLLSVTKVQSITDTPIPCRSRFCSGEDGRWRPEQRERPRAGQGRADLGLYS